MSKLWKSYAMNFCKKCGEFRGEFFKEMRWNVVIFIFFFSAFTALTAFLTLICHKNWCVEFLYEMRWIFVRIVNIYFHRIHSNHCIFYKNSPHSPHFLQKFNQTLDPGTKRIYSVSTLCVFGKCLLIRIWNLHVKQSSPRVYETSPPWVLS